MALCDHGGYFPEFHGYRRNRPYMVARARSRIGYVTPMKGQGTMPSRSAAGRHGHRAQPRRPRPRRPLPRWRGTALTLALAVTAGIVSYAVYPSPHDAPSAARHGIGVDTMPMLADVLRPGQLSSLDGAAAAAQPDPVVTAMASAAPRKTKSPAKRKPPRPAPVNSPSTGSSSSPAPSAGNSGPPLAGGNYAGSLLLNATGSQLASWNATSSFCPEQSWQVPDGTVGTDASGDATETVSGTGSCVALISPQSYSSAVIEADIDFPALPGSSGTIADWTSFWLTNGSAWPQDGELDAVEAEPVTGVNAVAWHGGSSGNEFSASTDDFFATKLPKDGPDLTPGWHTVDIVYTQGFFAVYYDGHEYTSYSSGNVTGDALNIYLTTSVTPDNGTIEGELGGPPVNSSGSPATVAIKYLKVWSYQ
jgi:hypothetical protein